MADFKPRPGTFLPYMESVNRRRLGQSAPASPLTLLEILSRNAQPSLPMFDLQTRSGMEPSRYAEALKSLRNAGYIAIEGEAPEQAIRLTDSGAEVTRLARPA
jgi:predicted transcriptional regulator